MKGSVTDEDAIQERFGVDPPRLVDIFALTGDAVDNVPGVPGIGEKTAVALIRQFGSLDQLYQNLEKLTKAKVRAALERYREQAYLSRRLVTIDAAVPIEKRWEECAVRPPDVEALRALYKQCEFSRLLQTLPPELRSDESENNYRLLTDQHDIAQLLSSLRARGCFAVDLETTAADPMRAEIVGISLSGAPAEAAYIPLGHRGLAGQPDRQAVLALLKPLLEDAGIKKRGHNIKYEFIIFQRQGISLQGVQCDTMIASYLLNPSKYRHSLDNVALDHLGCRLTSYNDLVGSGQSRLTFDQVPIEPAMRYACQDADITFRLADCLLPKIKQDGIEDLYYNIEMPLAEVLGRMEMTGVMVDTGHLQQLSDEFGRHISAVEQKIYELAGQRFNVNSPKQLGAVLFEKLHLPVQKRTKTGYATDIETLTGLANLHPLPAEVLAYRSLAKLKSTYVDAMPGLVNPATGRIHTSYNQTVTATGRLSSSDPNLQNIPIRTQEGRRIREAFVSNPGWKILSADYSQVELRILAHLSQDATLLDAFAKDEDVHTRTASEIWGVAPEAVTPQMRREAKVINFGIIYGMSSYGLSKELGLAPQVAQAYIDGYFAKYRGVRAYLDALLEQARQQGYVLTLMNRRRYLPEIASRNMAERRMAERTAINAPVQGSAADLIKIAMIRVAAALAKHGLQARMIMQVHDELVFEAPQEEVALLGSLVRQEMEAGLAISVPLKVDVNWGANWREAH